MLELKRIFHVKPKVLNRQEKRFIKNIIEPFRKCGPITVKKKAVFEYVNGVKEYTGKELIEIEMGDFIFRLPHFPKDKYYKGMVIDKLYLPEELGIKFKNRE